ncbi:MAG: NHLP bacteriocin system secretion protein [Cyanothece sp. SIO1E1]|nr:NHLP bacteriocin system secretion protein [Cyanothece sp. SIO1E1]
MPDLKHNLFRKESLERLSSPEQLDQLMQVIGPKSWIPLATLGSLVFIALVWSIFGRIPITVAGQGILIRPRRVIDFQSTSAGQLTALNVKDGQCVEKGEVLATMDPSDLKQQLQQEQDKLAQLQRQIQRSDRLQRQRAGLEEEAIAASRVSLKQRLVDTQALTPVFRDRGLGAIEEQRRSLLQRLRDNQSLAPVLEERLEIRENLVAEGALAAETLLESKQEYLQTLQTISDLEAQLKQLDVNATEAEQRYLQNLNSIHEVRAELQELDTRGARLQQENLESINQWQNQTQKVQQTIAQLEKQIADNSQILSPHAGCVLEISTTVGQVMNAGARLGTLHVQAATAQMVGITYFAVKDGKQIQPGMQIQITPDTVKRERFGGITGTVKDISPFPVTTEGTAYMLGNPEVAQTLIAEDSPKIETIAHLELDPSTFSGYQWSSSAGPEQELSTGTTTQARVKVEERAPITFVLPILREWSGLK